MNDTTAGKNGASPEEPPSWLQRAASRFIARWRSPSETEALREAVEELMDEVAASDGPPAVEREFLSNLVSLRDKDVGDCMVPRAQIVSVDADCDMQTLITIINSNAHSRIPAYRETLDNVVGMVHIKDVLYCVTSGQGSQIRDLLRPVLFVAPSMPAAKLLLQMRQTRRHMAMVVDEYGGIDGLVTIEDLVEEIVGEIEDEHDVPSTPMVIARSDGSLLVDASLKIEAFEDRVGTLLTREERETIDTLGGFVFHLAGHVPQIGETVAGPDGISFDVLETNQNRITRVRVRGLRPSEKSEMK